MPFQLVIQTKGIEATIQRLQGLSGKELERKTRNVLTRSVRAILVPPVRREAQKIAKAKTGGKYPHPAGVLAKKVHAVQIKRRTGEMVAVSVGPKRGKNGAWWAGWVIRGTKPHVIRARNGGSLFFNGSNISEVHHPGAKSDPFVKRGVQGKEAALAARIKKELLKEH